jgi:hypothetical protein
MIDEKKLSDFIAMILGKGYTDDFLIYLHEADLKTVLTAFLNRQLNLAGVKVDPIPFLMISKTDGINYNMADVTTRFKVYPDHNSGLEIKSFQISGYDLELKDNPFLIEFDISGPDEIPTITEALTMGRRMLTEKKPQLPSERIIDDIVNIITAKGYSQSNFSNGYLFKDDRSDLKTCLLNHIRECGGGERLARIFPHKVTYLTKSATDPTIPECCCVFSFEYSHLKGLRVAEIELLRKSDSPDVAPAEGFLKISSNDTVPLLTDLIHISPAELLIRPKFPGIANSKINTYRFRAECETDVENLKTLLPGHYVVTRETLNVKGEEVPIPDVTVELTTLKPIKEVIEKMRSVSDGHVMAETVEYFTEYTGIRNRRSRRL